MPEAHPYFPFKVGDLVMLKGDPYKDSLLTVVIGELGEGESSPSAHCYWRSGNDEIRDKWIPLAILRLPESD